MVSGLTSLLCVSMVVLPLVPVALLKGGVGFSPCRVDVGRYSSCRIRASESLALVPAALLKGGVGFSPCRVAVGMIEVLWFSPCVCLGTCRVFHLTRKVSEVNKK